MLLSSHRVDEIINLINRIDEIDYGRVVQDEQTKIFSAQIWSPEGPYQLKYKAPKKISNSGLWILAPNSWILSSLFLTN